MARQKGTVCCVGITEPSPMQTLAVDCGGTGLKAIVLDANGEPVCERVRVKTPYPCPPPVIVEALTHLADATGVGFDRASVGFPGLVRDGVVRATPHFVTVGGPFTAVRPDLVAEWKDFDVQSALQEAFGVPTRVANDAEIAGLAVVSGQGFEMMFTLGTGWGCALYDDGRLLPKIELSQMVWRKGQTLDQRLGHHTRTRIGNAKWNRRIQRVINDLRPVFWWDHAYIGGGGAKFLTSDLGPDISVVGNEMGLLGGIRLWDER